MAGLKYRRVIFVCGPARSGTTLLYRLLCDGEHHRCFSECTILTTIVSTMMAHANTTPDRFEDYFGSDEKKISLYRGLCDELIGNLLRNEPQRDVLFLKDPLMQTAWKGYQMLFEDSSFLAIVRNPENVLASRYDVAKRANRDFDWQKEIARASQDFRRMMAIAAEHKDDKRFVCIRYVDLVSEPEKTIAHLESSLDISIQPELQPSSKKSGKAFKTKSSDASWFVGESKPFERIPRVWHLKVKEQLAHDVRSYENAEFKLTG